MVYCSIKLLLRMKVWLFNLLFIKENFKHHKTGENSLYCESPRTHGPVLTIINVRLVCISFTLNSLKRKLGDYYFEMLQTKARNHCYENV